MMKTIRYIGVQNKEKFLSFHSLHHHSLEKHFWMCDFFFVLDAKKKKTKTFIYLFIYKANQPSSFSFQTLFKKYIYLILFSSSCIGTHMPHALQLSQEKIGKTIRNENRWRNQKKKKEKNIG